MSKPKIATVVVLYGIGGELDREPVRSNRIEAVNAAVLQLVNRCTLDIGDRIVIEGDRE